VDAVSVGDRAFAPVRGRDLSAGPKIAKDIERRAACEPVTGTGVLKVARTLGIGTGTVAYDAEATI
jgi:hypothetical protein